MQNSPLTSWMYFSTQCCHPPMTNVLPLYFACVHILFCHPLLIFPSLCLVLISASLLCLMQTCSNTVLIQFIDFFWKECSFTCTWLNYFLFVFCGTTGLKWCLHCGQNVKVWCVKRSTATWICKKECCSTNLNLPGLYQIQSSWIEAMTQDICDFLWFMWGWGTLSCVVPEWCAVEVFIGSKCWIGSRPWSLGVD